MRYEHILVSAAAGLATITMNRPERRNALSEAHMRELIAALGAAGAEPDTRAIVLAANGPVFSAGHDFADMVERDLDGMRRLLATCTELMLTLQRLPQPVVPRARLAEETEALARAASRGSVASKALGKHTFYDTIDLDLEAAYTRACEAMATSAMTPDGREAMLSFLEKRPGVYPARR